MSEVKQYCDGVDDDDRELVPLLRPLLVNMDLEDDWDVASMLHETLHSAYNKGVDQTNARLNALATVEASAQGEPGRVELRAAVRWFAEQMELELRKNDHKGGWHEMDPLEICERIDDELLELKDSLGTCPPWGKISEAADVGAMAMMVADHFREGGPSRDQGHTLLAPPPKGLP